MMHIICSVSSSVMTLFNDLNLKIIKLTLYTVHKNKLSLLFFIFRACTCYQSIELLETNNLRYFRLISKVVLLLH